MKQIPHAVQDAVDGVGEVARRLLHPSALWLANDARDLDSACRDVDDEKDVVADQAGEREHLDGEEVHGSDDAEVRLQEGPAGHPLASRGRGLEPVLEEDSLDRVSANHLTNVSKGAADPRVTPA